MIFWTEAMEWRMNQGLDEVDLGGLGFFHRKSLSSIETHYLTDGSVPSSEIVDLLPE
jgi:hypothetical protein